MTETDRGAQSQEQSPGWWTKPLFGRIDMVLFAWIAVATTEVFRWFLQTR